MTTKAKGVKIIWRDVAYFYIQYIPVYCYYINLQSSVPLPLFPFNDPEGCHNKRGFPPHRHQGPLYNYPQLFAKLLR